MGLCLLGPQFQASYRLCQLKTKGHLSMFSPMERVSSSVSDVPVSEVFGCLVEEIAPFLGWKEVRLRLKLVDESRKY